MKGFRPSISVALFLMIFLIPGFVTAEVKKVFTLDELLSVSMEANPSAAVFKANLEASRGEVISASAYPNPEVDLEGGRGKSLETGESKGEYSLVLGQPIEWPSKRHFRKKAAKASVEASEKELDDFHLELKAEVKKAFFQLLKNKKILETSTENSKIAGELLKTAELKVKAGEAPEFELIKAKVEALRADKELKRAGNTIAASKAILNGLLGNTLKADFDVEGEFKVPERKYEIQALLSNAMEKHPLVLKAKKDAEAKDYSLERERASVFPDVTVKGFFNKEIDKDSYGVGLSVPIPFWYQRKGEIATASAEKTRAEAEVYRTKVELAKSITEEYQNYAIALDQIEVFEKGLLKEAEEALRIAEFSYRHGESGLLDYLDTQRVYRSTFIEYYQSLFELESSLAALERVAGGLPQ
ncbi:MAG: TolC family protein [Deltaproteobacteria bacterium]|nr:TolC family protein [Deltaproteobacteria bacterium]